MKKISIFIAAMILLSISLNISCTKEDGLTNSPDVQEMGNLGVVVENGRLTFKSGEAMSNTISLLLSMNDVELNAWGKRKGFVSLWSLHQKVYKELENVVTKEDVYQILERYSMYFEIITDENGEQVMKAKIDDPIYIRITNVEGEYALPGKINKVINNKVLSINEEDYPEISQLSEIELLAMVSHELKYIEPGGGGGGGGTSCGSSKQVTYTKDVSGCDRDRRVTIRINTYVDDYTNHTIAWVYGERRAICIWFRYTTLLDLKDASFTAKYPYAYSSQWGVYYHSYSFTFPDISAESNEIVSEHFHYDGSINYWGANSYFTNVNGKASSRGVDNNWAEIDCN